MIPLGRVLTKTSACQAMLEEYRSRAFLLFSWLIILVIEECYCKPVALTSTDLVASCCAPSTLRHDMSGRVYMGDLKNPAKCVDAKANSHIKSVEPHTLFSIQLLKLYYLLVW